MDEQHILLLYRLIGKKHKIMIVFLFHVYNFNEFPPLHIVMLLNFPSFTLRTFLSNPCTYRNPSFHDSTPAHEQPNTCKSLCQQSSEEVCILYILYSLTNEHRSRLFYMHFNTTCRRHIFNHFFGSQASFLFGVRKNRLNVNDFS